MKPSSLHRVLAAAALVVVPVAGCDRPPRDTLSREAFIATYVDLRVAALRTESEPIADSTKARILEAHGVTEGQLLGFVEARGRELDFMRDLWNEVEMRLDTVPPLPTPDATAPDTVSPEPLPDRPPEDTLP